MPEKVKLFVALISNNVEIFDKVRSVLEKRLRNPVDFESSVMDFTHTNYYNDEMGENLKRKFFGFKKNVGLENLAKVKLLANRIEGKFSRHGKRAVNLDPGYLDLSKVVLFSTKDYSHRIYAADGIYAEVALFYKDKKFNPWPWTYPDYKTDDYIKVFDSIREIYKKNRES